MSKQGTAGKRKCATLIAQKLEIIRRLEHGKSLKCSCDFLQHWIVNDLWYKETRTSYNHLWHQV